MFSGYPDFGFGSIPTAALNARLAAFSRPQQPKKNRYGLYFLNENRDKKSSAV